MQKNYPVIYNQNNYGATDLGNSTVDTIKSGGCFDSCCAMKATFYGHPTDPIQMNKLFIDKGVYVQIDLLPDNAVSQVFPDIKYINTLNYEPVPTDLNHIRDLLNDLATTLTIRINFGGGNFHFVEAVSCDGTVLHIANPISGQVEDFSQRYGNPVTANLHVLVFQGPLQLAQTTTSDQTQTGSSPLALRFSQAIAKSTNFDAVADYFGLSTDQRVAADAGQQVVEKIKYLSDQVQGLQSQLTALQKPPVLVNTTTPAPVAPEWSTTAPNPNQTAITFSTGKNPISSSQDAKVTTDPKAPNSPSMLSGSVSPLEFLKAIWRILFI